jgi:hypothetical protein
MTAMEERLLAEMLDPMRLRCEVFAEVGCRETSRPAKSVRRPAVPVRSPNPPGDRIHSRPGARVKDAGR